jgi:hypothetical protein
MCAKAGMPRDPDPEIKSTLAFTLAHPAAVLPFRRFLVFSALIVGSLAPDFHYFFNLGPRGHFSHSIKGAFLFALPLSIVALWIFETLMKVPLISLAPQPHQEKLVALAKPFRWLPAGRFAVVLLSLLVGIGTHMLWDSLTHERGLVVRNFPDLSRPALEDFGTERPLYDILQHTSTLTGLLILAIWYWRWFRRAPSHAVPRNLEMSSRAKAWIVAGSLMLVTGISLAWAFYVVTTRSSRRLSLFVGTAVTTWMSLTFTSALAYSLWWRWRNRRD